MKTLINFHKHSSLSNGSASSSSPSPTNNITQSLSYASDILKANIQTPQGSVSVLTPASNYFDDILNSSKQFTSKPKNSIEDPDDDSLQCSSPSSTSSSLSINQVNSNIDDNLVLNTDNKDTLIQKSVSTYSINDTNVGNNNNNNNNNLEKLSSASISNFLSNSLSFLRVNKLSISDSLIRTKNSTSRRSIDSTDSKKSNGQQIQAKNSCVENKINRKSCAELESELKSSITTDKSLNPRSPWDILCKIINCKVAFKKQFNGKKYNWIQLAGHAGRFKPGEREGFILKLMDTIERRCLEELQADELSPYVPNIDKVLFDSEDGKYYSEMQDLLYGFNNPSIMDIKLGVRTFLEKDLDEKESKPRHDLYLKLIEMAPDEPTPYEHQVKAINKRRYMSWREKSTCSATLGFRIEAIKKNQVHEKEFYTVKEKKDVQAHFRNYTDNKKDILKMYIDRLIGLRETLKSSKFFYSHEMIGSSLLFVHDSQKASIWMIDFGKTRPLPEGVKITHSDRWIDGNHEDGYLIGLNSLIDIFQEIYNS